MLGSRFLPATLVALGLSFLACGPPRAPVSAGSAMGASLTGDAAPMPAPSGGVAAPAVSAAPAAAKGCAAIPDLPELTVLGGRPYGVFPAGVRRLDRAGTPVAPVGQDRPVAGGDALADRPTELSGTWPDQLVAQMPRQVGNFPGSDAFSLEGGRWRRLATPPEITGYLQLARAGGPRVVGIGVSGLFARLLVLSGPGRFPASRRSPAANAWCGAGGIPTALAISPGGRIAVFRRACRDGLREQSASIERFDDDLRSVAKVPFWFDGLAPFAWLDDETILAGVREDGGAGRERFVALEGRAVRDLDLPPGDGVTGFTRTAEGTLLVSTRKHWFEIGAKAKLVGAQHPWSELLSLSSAHRAFVKQIAYGEDHALYLQLVEATGTSVLRCALPKASP